MSVIQSPVLYVPDPSRGRPLFYGQVYIGEPDLDPLDIPLNQKQLNVVQEDGSLVAVAQPFILSAGGTPVYQGSNVQLDTTGNYSMVILDKNGDQVYYIANSAEYTGSGEQTLYTTETSVTLVDGQLDVDLSGANVDSSTIFTSNGSGDRGRLIEGIDYEVTGTSTILLYRSYDSGTVILAQTSVLATASNSFVKKFKSLDVAIADGAIEINDVLNIEERIAGNGGSAVWDAVDITTVTPNEYDIVTCTTKTDVALVIRAGDGYSLRQAGVVAGSSVDFSNADNNSLAVSAWKSLCDDRDITGLIDTNGEYFAISSDAFLPKVTDGDRVFTTTGQGGGFITNNDSIIHYRQASYGRMSNVSFPDGTIRIEGGQFHIIKNIRSKWIILDGYSAEIGMFWCNFSDLRGNMVFDLSVFAINQNVFTNCNPFGDADEYAIEITDNGGTQERECHQNIFYNLDISRSKGIINNSELNQKNLIIGLYAESMTSEAISPGSNFDVSGMNMDNVGPLPLPLYSSVQNTTDQSQATGADFMSEHYVNHAIGGQWDILGSDGIPPSIKCSGGAVIDDPSAPMGSTQMIGKTTSSDFQSITVTGRPTQMGGSVGVRMRRVSVIGFWRGDIPEAIVFNGANYTPELCFTPLADNYWVFRATTFATEDEDCVLTLFITTTGGGSRTGYLGNVFMTDLKRCPTPKTQQLVGQVKNITYLSGGLQHVQGSLDLWYSETSPMEAAILFPVEFAGSPVVLVTLEALNDASFSRTTNIQIKDVSSTGFTVQVRHNGDYTGTVHWSATGMHKNSQEEAL